MFDFSSLIFKKTCVFIEEYNPSEKVVIVEEGLDGIDIDDIVDIANLEDSPRLAFIDEECENLMVDDDGGELTRNFNEEKNSDLLQ